MTGVAPEVVIDCLPQSLARYGEGWTIVGVDVIRATTSAVGEVARGREVFPVPTLQAALLRARPLDNPLLSAELVARWRGAPVSAIAAGHSAAYLRRSGQVADLDFVLGHIDDLDTTVEICGQRLVLRAPGPGPGDELGEDATA